MINKVILEKAFLGRSLTDSERTTVETVNRLDPDVGKNLMGIIKAAKENGLLEGSNNPA